MIVDNGIINFYCVGVAVKNRISSAKLSKGFGPRLSWCVEDKTYDDVTFHDVAEYQIRHVNKLKQEVVAIMDECRNAKNAEDFDFDGLKRDIMLFDIKIERIKKEYLEEIEMTGRVLVNKKEAKIEKQTQHNIQPKSDYKRRGINSKKWQEIRVIAMDILPMKCGRCDSKKSLCVDHVKPVSAYPELKESLSNMQILCKRCNSWKGDRNDYDYRTESQKAALCDFEKRMK